MLWEALGRLWGGFGEALRGAGRFCEALRSFVEALGRFWGGFGRLWEAAGTLLKPLGSR